MLNLSTSYSGFFWPSEKLNYEVVFNKFYC